MIVTYLAPYVRVLDGENSIFPEAVIPTPNPNPLLIGIIIYNLENTFSSQQQFLVVNRRQPNFL